MLITKKQWTEVKRGTTPKKIYITQYSFLFIPIYISKRIET